MSATDKITYIFEVLKGFYYIIETIQINHDFN